MGPKGRGSNMRAIVEACAAGRVAANVQVVVSPLDTSPAADFVRAQGLKLSRVTPGENYEQELFGALEGVTLICLAGYTRLLPLALVEAYRGSILNIHPALLPKFGGKGMYGTHVHEAVLAAGETESGCTVHKVTPVYDEGEIVLQMKCPVLPDDTAETLSARVLQLEHVAYPEALKKVIHERSR